MDERAEPRLRSVRGAITGAITGAAAPLPDYIGGAYVVEGGHDPA